MDPTPRASRRPLRRWLALLLLLVALAAALWAGWRGWQTYQQQRVQAADLQRQQQQQQAVLERRLDALRREQRALGERIQDAASTNRVLREEMLGLAQRNAALEETVSRLADPARHGAAALRLDEVELLLSQGQQRLVIAGDLDGARHAYALAAGALAGIDDPAYLNLRQTLSQERSALDGTGVSPQITLAAQLDRLAAALATLPGPASAAAAAPERPWWHSLLSPLVRVRPVQRGVLVAASERAGAGDALQIDLGLARSALERNDAIAWKQALLRADGWLSRLWPDTPALRQRRTELVQLQRAPLRPSIPELGTTLLQLRSMREGRNEP